MKEIGIKREGGLIERTTMAKKKNKQRKKKMKMKRMRRRVI